jgi:hypothetical protein
LIKIYDDDESPEVSLVTPVHIEEEKEPEKTSSPVPDAQIQGLPQNEQEIESVLDTELPNAPETQADSPKDEPGSGEQKEEAPQQEINVSMTDDQVSTEPTPDASISIGTQLPDERQTEVGPSEHREEVQEPSLEQVYTIGSLGNTLTWGDQQIPEPMDEVADIHAIAYDRKRKAIIQRTTKKRRITLDRSILITTEENLINTEHAKTSKLIGAGMEITDATLDRAKRDEEELATALKELEHLRHLEKYYQDTTQAAVFLRSEFQEAYNKFTDERHLFTARIVELQEDTLMALATCKDMERWYEKAQQAMERVDYISAVQQGRDTEEHDIQVLKESSLDRIKKSAEYWEKMARNLIGKSKKNGPSARKDGSRSTR